MSLRIARQLFIGLLMLASLSSAGAGQARSREVYRVTPVLFSGTVASLDNARYRTVVSVVSNKRGDSAFTAWWQDQDFEDRSGIFLVSGGGVTTLATGDTPVSGVTGARFVDNLPWRLKLSINDAGEVAIAMPVAVTEFTSQWRLGGLFVFRNGSLSLLATRDQDISGLSINDRGDIAFTDGTGLFVSSGSGISTIASKDQGFRFIRNLSINNARQLAFPAYNAAGRSELFFYSQGAISTLVLEGQPAPEGGGNTFDLLAFSGLDDSGAILFPGDKADDVIVGRFRPQTHTRFGL